MGQGGSSGKSKEELVASIKARNVGQLNEVVARLKPSPAVLNSLLHLAVQVSNGAIMSRLVELGADPASIVEDPFSQAIGVYTGGKGTTLLHKAALYANVEVRLHCIHNQQLSLVALAAPSRGLSAYALSRVSYVCEFVIDLLRCIPCVSYVIFSLHLPF